MSINLKMSDIRELKPRIIVFGVGGAGGNAVNNMIESGLNGVDFVVANTDAQALTLSKAEHIIQMGVRVTEGLGAGSQPEVGAAAAEEVIDEIRQHLQGAHMAFITAGMGGGTGTGAAAVVARAAREMGILTVGVVTKPFQFEGQRRMRTAETGINALQAEVDTLIVIPNQNLFRVANEKTTFADAFALADEVLYSGVACITDLMVKEGLINLDFADVRSIMQGMGRAMMGTGEASGEKRALNAAEQAIANPLLDETTMKGARGLLISITGGNDLTLYEVDEAATRIREEVDQDANIILGATFDKTLDGIIRVSVVATGIEQANNLYATISAPAVEAVSKVRMPMAAQTPSVATSSPSYASGSQGSSGSSSAPAYVMQSAAAPIGKTEVNERASMTAPTASSMTAPAAKPFSTMYAPQAASGVSQRSPLSNASMSLGSAGGLYTQAAAAVQAKVEDGLDVRESQMRDLELELESALDQKNEDYGAYTQEPVMKATRMPEVDELPLHTQQQIKGEVQDVQPVEKRRMTLLQRLAAVGLGRSSDEVSSDDVALSDAKKEPQAEVKMPQAEMRKPQMPQASAGYRPAQGQLDQQGRVSSVSRSSMEDDHLEIPAFLRRQNT
jgi:cell division protein FtsZ